MARWGSWTLQGSAAGLEQAWGIFWPLSQQNYAKVCGERKGGREEAKSLSSQKKKNSGNVDSKPSAACRLGGCQGPAPQDSGRKLNPEGVSHQSQWVYPCLLCWNRKVTETWLDHKGTLMSWLDDCAWPREKKNPLFKTILWVYWKFSHDPALWRSQHQMRYLPCLVLHSGAKYVSTGLIWYRMLNIHTADFF